MARIVIVGGGAAGFFAAITCAEAAPQHDVTILEKGAKFLAKVKISGGGRCNVTHACFEPNALSEFYPRGERELRGPFNAFSPTDTIEWFKRRGVTMYTQDDGCLFPDSDDSQTIIDCFLHAAGDAGVKMRASCGVERAAWIADGSGFELTLSGGEKITCDRLLLATGGARSAAMAQLAVDLGHTLESPVPSLFTFHIEMNWLRVLAGIVVPEVEVSAPDHGLRERGILLITHWGLSGPVILRTSAWGARKLHDARYHFPLIVNWLPAFTPESLAAEFERRRNDHPAKLVVNTPVAPLQTRLWEALVLASGVERATRWAEFSRTAQHKLIGQLTRSEFPVSGKSMNKDEFVTCGGVRLNEVNFKTMESRITRGLYFAGELLDIDGLTGGFNFQACWTTGFLAGNAMAHD